MGTAERKDVLGTAGKPVDVAVIIPIFKHSGLFIEAVESVLAQEGGLELRIVLVDDGCPLPETQVIARAYAAAHDGTVHYLRRRNGGLSAARNTGIGYALNAWPEVAALYMLDADNRIAPPCLARSLEALRNSPPETGWIYPDISDFGFRASHEPAREYSLYFHLWENYCEAGSLIRRDVFERGARFDETLRMGFEDWEFWLQANKLGFKGQYLRDAGFSYRRRAESMLTQAERNRPELLQTLRRKHADLFEARALLALEHEQAPRFALVCDGGPTSFTSDPLAPGSDIGTETCWRHFRHAFATEGRTHFPPFAIFTSSDCLDLLNTAGVLRWALWRCESLLEHADVACIVLATSVLDETVGFSDFPDNHTADLLNNAFSLVMLRSDRLHDAAHMSEEGMRGWLSKEAGGASVKGVTLRCMPADWSDTAALPAATLQFMLAETDVIRASWRKDEGVIRGRWRMSALIPRTRSHEIARNLLQTGPLLPVVPRTGQIDIGFILPLVAFGGVEKCVMNYAAVARERGWRPHLFIFNASTAQIPRQFSRTFDSVNFLSDSGYAQWSAEETYFGAVPSGWASTGNHRSALGLLASMSMVFSTHSADAHGLMAELRQFGVKTIAGLHVVEQAGFGRPLGQPHLLLAYEHAYDLIAVISEDLRRCCLSLGFPEREVSHDQERAIL